MISRANVSYRDKWGVFEVGGWGGGRGGGWANLCSKTSPSPFLFPFEGDIPHPFFSSLKHHNHNFPSLVYLGREGGEGGGGGFF